MTNGSNITDDFISFAKSIWLNPIMVSIDGPEESHNYARKYVNGTGSFNDVVNGIKKLQMNGFDVIASVVITPKNSNLEKIVDYLLTLDIKSISFGLSRGLSDVCQFNRETIEVLLTSIDRIYKRILDDLIKTGVSTLFKILRGSILFNVVK